jgi:hypothetical protein
LPAPVNSVDVAYLVLRDRYDPYKLSGFLSVFDPMGNRIAYLSLHIVPEPTGLFLALCASLGGIGFVVIHKRTASPPCGDVRRSNLPPFSET